MVLSDKNPISPTTLADTTNDNATDHFPTIHPYTYSLLVIISLFIVAVFIGDQINLHPILNRRANSAQSAKAIDSLKSKITEQSFLVSERPINQFRFKPFKELRLTAPIVPLFTNKTANPIAQPKPIESLIEKTPVKSGVSPVTINQKLIIPKKGGRDITKSVIQILCKTPTAKGAMYISSTGFLISETGLILTNAHVGVHPFLDKYTESPIACTGRHGSPAQKPFAIRLIYISPKWTAKHQGETHGSFTLDTGEFDVAVLKTDENLTQAGLEIADIYSISDGIFGLYNNQDSKFQLENGVSLKFLAYPIIGTPTSLLQRSELLNVEDVFDLGSAGSGNLIQSSPSTIGKSGASGGPLFDSDNRVVAMASNIINSSSGIKLHAIDIAHINHTLLSDTGISLHTLIHTSGHNLENVFEEKLKSQVQNHLIQK